MEAPRLGPFELIEVAGRGGMGEVWRGVHVAHRLPVAVKVLTAAQARQPAFQAAFRYEAQTVAGLDHRHVVHVFDYGAVPPSAVEASAGALVEGSPFLVMEWASGGSLAGGTSWPESWDALAAVLRALLEALAHAHARGVVHRDLKPGNVLVCTADDLRPGVKLADFGVASFAGPGGGDRAATVHATPGPPAAATGAREAPVATPSVAGTPQYMAPEQASGDARAQGPWTDLYALGALAYKLASGATPFAGLKGDMLGWARAHAPVPPLVANFPIPAAFEEWLGRLLAKDPAARFRCAADAAWALGALGPPAAPAAAPAAHAGRARDDGTTVGGALVEMPESAKAGGRGGGAGPALAGAAPLAARWGGDDAGAPSPALLDAGLRLFGLRAVPMVGRRVERDALWEALASVHRTGRARAVVLRGSAGCGKSRLAEWLCERAHETGAAIPLRAVHGPLPAVPSDGLGPMLARYARVTGGEGTREDLVSAVHAAFRVGRGDDPDEAAALAELCVPAEAAADPTAPVAQDTRRPPEVDDRGPARRRIIRLAGPAERHFLVARALRRLAAERPVVVWLDDVQWGADALAFAAHALDAQAETPLRALLVLTAQDEALAEHGAEREALDRLSARPDVETLAIGPLGSADMPALLGALLRLRADVAAQVAARCAGNPLFAVHLLGDWVHGGVLEPAPDGFRLRAGTSPALPPDLQAVWTARIERVLAGTSPGEGVAVEIAATLGHEVDGAEWRDACVQAGLAAPPVDLVERLCGQRLARAGPGGPARGWSFVHAILREAVALRARAAGRTEALHAACSRMLGTRSGRGVAERLGRHRLAAGDAGGALQPLVDGARENLMSGDRPVAEGLLRTWEEAMAALGPPEPSDPRWGKGWVAWSRVCRFQARWDLAAQWAERAEQGARRWGWQDALPEALSEGGEIARVLGDLVGAERKLAEAVALAEARGDRRTAANAALRLGLVHLDGGRLADAEPSLRRALDEGTASAEETVVGNTLMALASLHKQSGRFEASHEYALRAWRHCDAIGFRVAAADCLNMVAGGARLLGRLAEAEERCREARDRARAVGGAGLLFIEVNLAMTIAERGRPAEARPALEGGLATFEARGLPQWAGITHALLLPCVAALADWDAFAHHVAEATARLSATTLVEYDVARAAETGGDAAWRAGRGREAEAAWRLAQAQWRALGQRDRAAAADPAARAAMLAEGA